MNSLMQDFGNWIIKIPPQGKVAVAQHCIAHLTAGVKAQVFPVELVGPQQLNCSNGPDCYQKHLQIFLCPHVK